MQANLFNTLLNIEFILAVIIFVLLRFITAPYGRFERKGWGPSISSRLAWIIMEMPSFVIPFIFLITSSFSVVSLVFVTIWQSHYFHRTMIYPFRIADPEKPFFIIIMSWGFIFNLINSYVNFYYIFRIRPLDDILWLTSWKFLAGLSFFLLGYILNKSSDAILRSLRKENRNSYSVPVNGLFRWISAPNYLGEILEWGGWALLTWSLSGTAFFFFTIANLAPRAVTIHNWYLSQFNDYPKERKALIPYLL
jgi:3-oxo-5-alpha-steroid 4-dehydrogenase 1